MVHAVARLCRAREADALALLSTAAGMGRWNLGLWQTREVSPGLMTGSTLFGGGEGFAEVVVDAATGVVDYRVGASAQALVPRIQARVQRGRALGHPEGTCLVTLLAWRAADMDEARWQRLIAAHEVEIDIIRGVLEAGFAADGAAQPASTTPLV